MTEAISCAAFNQKEQLFKQINNLSKQLLCFYVMLYDHSASRNRSTMDLRALYL